MANRLKSGETRGDVAEDVGTKGGEMRHRITSVPQHHNWTEELKVVVAETTLRSTGEGRRHCLVEHR
jgi:hypothetical protein